MSSDLPPPSGPPTEPARSPLTLEQVLAGVVMALIMLISLGNVVVRYLTSRSFAATEELSIALLVILAFLGSSTAFAFDRHIRVTYFIEKLSPPLRRGADWLAFVATAASFGLIAWYGGWLAFDQYRFEETSPALGLPQWWYTAWMPALAVVVVLRLVLTRASRKP